MRRLGTVTRKEEIYISCEGFDDGMPDWLMGGFMAQMHCVLMGWPDFSLLAKV